jgi:hypothetical protein
MDLKQEPACRKKNGKECSFEFKTFVIEQINNGQISLNFAAKKYNVSKSGVEIAYKVDEPNHESVRKEMDRGRLLFYVTFKGGTAYLDIDNLTNILGIKGNF